MLHKGLQRYEPLGGAIKRGSNSGTTRDRNVQQVPMCRCGQDESDDMAMMHVTGKDLEIWSIM